MTSEFEAPKGPTSPMPPPPPGRVPPPGQVVPPPPAAAPSTPAPPPPPPAATPPPATPPAVPAASPAAGPAPVRPAPAPASPPPTPSPAAPGVDDDLDDILARLGAEPEPEPPTPTAAEHAADDASGSAVSAPVVGAALTDPRDLERPTAAAEIVIEAEGGLDFDPSFATFGKRAVELLVDMLVLGVATFPGVLLAALAGGSSWILGMLVSLAGFLVFVVLTGRSIAATGRSVGNRVADTRIVDGITGKNVDVGRAILRTFVRHAFSTILMLGFIIAFFDGQRRTFHDLLARTVVVGREREVWTADSGHG